MGKYYTQSGVNEDQARIWVKQIQERTEGSAPPEVLSGIGGFAALYSALGSTHVLVSAADGVGTKLWLAETEQDFYHLGIDLVAACTNDIAVYGAQPLFFLDYLSLSQYEWPYLHAFFEGMIHACHHVSCSLVGGETAQLPSSRERPIHDVCGFVVGSVEKSAYFAMRDRLCAGDMVVALSSSGFHANGFSLIRQIVQQQKIMPRETVLNNRSLHEHLMQPTLLYTPCILALAQHVPIHAMANITGGGLYLNLQRVLPQHLYYSPDWSDYVLPEIYTYFQMMGDLPEEELWSTWNCGIGFVCMIAPDDWLSMQQIAEEHAISVQVIGVIQEKSFQLD